MNRPEYCVAKAGLSMVAQLFAVRLAGAGDSRLRDPTGPDRDGHDRRCAWSLYSAKIARD